MKTDTLLKKVYPFECVIIPVDAKTGKGVSNYSVEVRQYYGMKSGVRNLFNGDYGQVGVRFEEDKSKGAHIFGSAVGPLRVIIRADGYKPEFITMQYPFSTEKLVELEPVRKGFQRCHVPHMVT